MKTLLLIALSSLLTWETQAQSALNEATDTASQSAFVKTIVFKSWGNQNGPAIRWRQK